jgi:uncharacterized protein YhbP (UPF0306 family)
MFGVFSCLRINQTFFMDKAIVDFIDKQKVTSVSCLDEKNRPYCFSVFYLFDHIQKRLYFKSSASSHHAHYLAQNKIIAGTILPDKLNLLAVRGVQFTGYIIETGSAQHHAAAEYHKRYPHALAMPGHVWTIQLQAIKMTDNTIGIGKKICWQREDLYEEIC